MRSLIRKFIDHFPRLSLFIRTMREIKDRSQKAVITPWGFSFVGNKIMADGNFEPEETALIRAILPRIDICINIGANTGYYCCHALSFGKAVIAVEPIYQNLWYLLKNIQDNGWSSQAEIFPLAVGEKSGILEIYGWGTGASLIKGWAQIPEWYRNLTPILTLDRILNDRLDKKKALMIVDIEGAEYMLLKGAKKALNSHPPPLWLVEISLTEHQPLGTPVNPNFRNTFEVFFDHGYKSFTADKELTQIRGEMLSPIIKGDLKIHTHNFLFVHKSDDTIDIDRLRHINGRHKQGG